MVSARGTPRLDRRPPLQSDAPGGCCAPQARAPCGSARPSARRLQCTPAAPMDTPPCSRGPAYPLRLCSEWRAIMLKNLGD